MKKLRGTETRRPRGLFFIPDGLAGRDRRRRSGGELVWLLQEQIDSRERRGLLCPLLDCGRQNSSDELSQRYDFITRLIARIA